MAVVGSQLCSWHLNEGRSEGGGCTGIWIQFQGAFGQEIIQSGSWNTHSSCRYSGNSSSSSSLELRRTFPFAFTRS